jgi:hypothetical protein
MLTNCSKWIIDADNKLNKVREKVDEWKKWAKAYELQESMNGSRQIFVTLHELTRETKDLIIELDDFVKHVEEP